MMAQTRLQSLLFLCTLLTAGFASPLDAIWNDRAADGMVMVNINNIFDLLKPSIQNFIIRHGLDPIDLEDMSENLKGIIIQERYLNFTNGWLQGLSGMTRAKDVILYYEDKLLILDATLGFDILHVNYEYLFKDALIKREGVMHSSGQNAEIRVIIGLDFKNYTIGLRTLKIVRLDKLQLKLEGHVLDPILNVAIKGITTVFRKKVTGRVEDRCSRLLFNFINKINKKFPRPDKVQESNTILHFVPIPHVSLLA